MISGNARSFLIIHYSFFILHYPLFFVYKGKDTTRRSRRVDL